MKKMFFVLVAAMMATTTFAQTTMDLARQQAELNEFNMKMLKTKPTKDAIKQAKQFRREGWTVMAGDPSIEQQIMQSQLYSMEMTTDESGAPTRRFLLQSGQSTAGTYNAAYAAARTAAQIELASLLKNQIVAAMQQKLDNAQADAITAVTIDKFNERARTIVDETLTNSIRVLSVYRRLPNNNFEVQVRLGYDKKELVARIKRNMQKELEHEGNSLDPIIEDVFCNKL